MLCSYWCCVAGAAAQFTQTSTQVHTKRTKHKKKNYKIHHTPKTTIKQSSHNICIFHWIFFIVATLYFASISFVLTWSLGMHGFYIYLTIHVALLWTQLLRRVALISFVCRFRNGFSFLFNTYLMPYCGIFIFFRFVFDRFMFGIQHRLLVILASCSFDFRTIRYFSRFYWD